MTPTPHGASAASDEPVSDRALAALWAAALSVSLAPLGDGVPLRLTPRELEHMILDQIDEERAELQPLTAARREAGAAGSFRQWFASVSEDPAMVGSLRAAIRDALKAIIDSAN